MKIMCPMAFALAVGLCLLLSIVPQHYGELDVKAAQTGDELVLRIGFTERIDSLNPLVGVNDASFTFYGLVYDALQGAGNDLEATPNLATNWWMVPETDSDMVLSGEPYGSVWQYNITHNAVWHDGTPFTADDVAWNINLHAQDYDAVWAFQPYTYFMSYAEVVDTASVRIHFSDRSTYEPIPVSFGHFLPIYMLPSHKFSEMDVFDIVFAWTGVFEEDPPMVGTGPFMAGPDIWDEYLSGSVVNLYKNPNHHFIADNGLETSIDRIELHFYDDPDELSLALQNGSLDVAKLPVDQYTELRDMVEGGLVDDITLFDGLRSDGHWIDIGFNMNDAGPNMARLDPSVRQALAMATNKTYIVEEMYSGYADEGSTLVSPIDDQWHYEPTAEEMLAFDPAEADAILEAAGYRYPYEGAPFRAAESDSLAVQMGWELEGTLLSFEMLVRAEHPEEVLISEYLTEAWAMVGVGLEVDVVDEVILSTIVYSYNYDTCIWYWYSEPDPNYILFCQSQRAWNGWNDNQYSTPEYEDNYNLSIAELDPVLREQYVDACQLINYQDAPYIVLAYTYQTYAWRTDNLIGWGDWAEDPGRSLDSYWTVNPLFFDLSPATVTNSIPENIVLEWSEADVYPFQPIEFTLSADDDDGDNLLVEVEFGDGESVEFTSEDSATHHEWTFNHSYVLQGDYDMLITIDDQTGLPDHVVSYGPVEITVLEDDVPPVTGIWIVGTLGLHEWYTSEVTVTLSASDIGSPTTSTQWSLNGGAWTEYEGVFEIAYAGINNITYRSIDANDNVEANKSVMLKIDTDAPVVSIDMDTTVTSTSAQIDVTWTDATSGVAHMVTSLDDGEWTSSFLMDTFFLEDLEDGEHTLTVTVYDSAGNSATDTVTFSVETSLFAMDGPAGPWLVIGLIAGIVAVIGAAGYLFIRKTKTK